MQGMCSIEKAVADSPLEDYQAIGQAAKKQVPRVHCGPLRGSGVKCGCSRGAEAGLVGESWEKGVLRSRACSPHDRRMCVMGGR